MDGKYYDTLTQLKQRIIKIIFKQLASGSQERLFVLVIKHVG